MSGTIEHKNTAFEALTQSLTLILVSEIGDKTFLIAAIMATRHPRLTVFGGAFASLMVMSILSAVMGKVVLGLIPTRYTQYVASLLFFVFGLRMVQEGLKIPSGSSHIQEEMREVEDELEEEEGMMDMAGRREAIEMEEGHANGSAGVNGLALNGIKKPHINTHPSTRHSFSSPNPFSSRTESPSRHPLSGPSSSTATRKPSHGSASASPLAALTKFRSKLSAGEMKASTRNFCSLFFSPVFAQAFILTFLGEWGDRSQIATIALAGANSVTVVAFGTILGHGVCTAGAVIGGRLLSTKISVRHITLIGAAAFLFFGVVYFYEGWTSAPELQVGTGLI